ERKAKAGCSRRCARLASEPVRRLSTAMTLKSSAKSRSTRCEPMNPAPPATTTRLIFPSLERRVPKRGDPAGVLSLDRRVALFALGVESLLLERAPPGLVGQVPGDGLVDAGLEGVLGFPAELALHLARVDGVALVVAGAVLDVADQALRLVQLGEDGPGDLHV